MLRPFEQSSRVSFVEMTNEVDIRCRFFGCCRRNNGKEIILPRKEFELFYLLASKPGKVFKRDEILDKVWGNEVVVGGRTIDVHIRKLREKIGEDLFKTIKGVGYKFEV